MRKQAMKMTLLGVTTLTTLQAMAQASSAPAEPQPQPQKPTSKAAANTPVPAPAAAAPAASPVVPDAVSVPTFAKPIAPTQSAAPAAASASAEAATPAVPSQAVAKPATKPASDSASIARPARVAPAIASPAVPRSAAAAPDKAGSAIPQPQADPSPQPTVGATPADVMPSGDVEQLPTRVEAGDAISADAGWLPTAAEMAEASLAETSELPALEYQVRSGDTLLAISAALEVPMEALIDANNLADATLIIAGESLVIPDLTPTETAQGESLKADFAAAVYSPAETVDPAAASDPTSTRLSYLQATAGRQIDRVSLLEQLRPDEGNASADDGVNAIADSDASDASADTSAPMADESAAGEWVQEETTPAADLLTQPSTQPDVHAARLLESLQTPAEVVTPDVSLPEPVEAATPPVAAPASGTLTAAAPIGSPSVITPQSSRQRTAPQPTVNSHDPILPDRQNYLPQPTDEVDGFIWPTRGTISSGYGWRWGRMHRGVDIAAATGTPIVASAPGVVEQAGWNNGGYGNLVDIRHPDGSLTRYAHNSRLLVQAGQQVEQGQPIAEMGSTGYSTGPHLHFEIHQPLEGTINPIAFMPDERLLLQ